MCDLKALREQAPSSGRRECWMARTSARFYGAFYLVTGYFTGLRVPLFSLFHCATFKCNTYFEA